MRCCFAIFAVARPLANREGTGTHDRLPKSAGRSMVGIPCDATVSAAPEKNSTRRSRIIFYCGCQGEVFWMRGNQNSYAPGVVPGLWRAPAADCAEERASRQALHST